MRVRMDANRQATMFIVNRRLVTLLCLVWLVLGSVFVLAAIMVQRSEIESDLQRESAILHRLVSQRADQHDAHLTGLSALAVSRDPVPVDLFLQVAAAIRRFYPRIVAIYLVPLKPGQPTLSTLGASQNISAVEPIIRRLARRSTGEYVLGEAPAAADHYLIVKRSPNSDNARFGLALEINSNAILSTDSPFWRKPSTTIELRLPNGSTLVGNAEKSGSSLGSLLAPVTFQKILGSRSQPLILSTRLVPKFSELVPLGQLVLGLGLLALVLAAIGLMTMLMSRIRRAEQRAQLGEHGARIAHASRVNALGEIASGMAHEITQPLTAILSQSQAGLRILAKDNGNSDAVKNILNANVIQSRRAAEILGRLRDWSKINTAKPSRQQINQCIENVVTLLEPELKRLSINLVIEADPGDPSIMGAAVEVEQVMFNLIRNAMDALADTDGADRRIRVVSRTDKVSVIVEVCDNGPGIAAEMLGRLLDPFTTGKEDGMGLGLALCERFVERMHGRIDVGNAVGGGATARVVFPSMPAAGTKQ